MPQICDQITCAAVANSGALRLVVNTISPSMPSSAASRACSSQQHPVSLSDKLLCDILAGETPALYQPAEL